MQRPVFPAVAVLALAGCALPAVNIAESHVGGAYYLGMDCRQLATARGNLRNEARLAARTQARFVGVLVPPREYQRNTQRIAVIKGTQAAIERAWEANGCGASPAADPQEFLAEPEATPEGEFEQDGDMAVGEESL